jgi:micrococcal nuclease
MAPLGCLRSFEAKRDSLMKKPSDSPFPPFPEDRFHRNALLIRVVDGDTLDVEIDLGWSMKLKERLRLEGLDTPEVRNQAEKKAGTWVKQEVGKFLPENTPLIIASMAYDRTGRVRGKYGRTMALVYRLADGACLNEYLLNNRMAWRTDDNGTLLDARTLIFPRFC